MISSPNYQRGFTPLHEASAEGHLGVVAALLKTGMVDIYARNKEGQTPMMLASKRKHTATILLLGNATGMTQRNQPLCTDLHRAAATGDVEEVARHLREGLIHPDALDVSGYTPFIEAVRNNHVAVIELLAATGKIDASRRFDFTVLSGTF